MAQQDDTALYDGPMAILYDAIKREIDGVTANVDRLREEVRDNQTQSRRDSQLLQTALTNLGRRTTDLEQVDHDAAVQRATLKSIRGRFAAVVVGATTVASSLAVVAALFIHP